MLKITKELALDYHSKGRPGKIEVVPTKPYSTQLDLSLAYTPGVAEPCLEIKKNPEDAYKYTAKGNLVAVITDGTAVLGLGDIGPLAGKPVMEGKGLLFKVFADIDVFDIEIGTKDVEKIIETIKLISPTFGGINLEDIKAPECFEIEERLKKELDIPVFHDDQHGTAIISGAGLLNALEINGKKIGDIKLVVIGAGASGIACTKYYISLGVRKENVLMFDSKGILSTKRTDLNKQKQEFAVDIDPKFPLTEALRGADAFLGLSVANILTKDMIRSMAEEPIVFAMANPTPEILYYDAVDARKDIIMATGRSDYPNQVNNVLGFPFIFRGALDVKATVINEEMKLAATYALAELAKEPVPEIVTKAYNLTHLSFGREYIIPKPLDPRLIVTIPPAIAKAAIETGVARKIITDWEAYKSELGERLGFGRKIIEFIQGKAKTNPKRVVFAEADNFKILKAAEMVNSEGIAQPVLLGDEGKIKNIINEYKLDLSKVKIINPRAPENVEKRKEYAQILYKKRQRKGLMFDEAYERIHNRDYFGIMMVETGEADAFISGFSSNYADIIKPALRIIGLKPSITRIAGMYILLTKKGPYFFADTTVNIEPTSDDLVEITLLVANEVKRFNIEPIIAMVSYSNFGSTKKGSPQIVRNAVRTLHTDYPDLLVDGEIQANFALNKDMRQAKYPFTKLGDKQVNTLIFPDLNSANIAYKMMQTIGEAEIVGPILLGMNKPIHILQIESSIREIVDMTAIAVVDAQEVGKKVLYKEAVV